MEINMNLKKWMEDVLVDFTLFYKKKTSTASKIQFWGASPTLDDSNTTSEHLYTYFANTPLSNLRLLSLWVTIMICFELKND